MKNYRRNGMRENEMKENGNSFLDELQELKTNILEV